VSNKSTFVITEALPDDLGIILGFIQELADYEREPDAVIATVDDLRAALFCEQPKVFAVICRDAEKPVGFALYFFNFSTWLGQHGVYLEDLYVTPAQRGRGAGKALLRHLARIAVDNNCGRFEWSVLDWNEPAIRFYESLGARPQSEWITYRMTGAELNALAVSYE
jgi:GNAT superfamily N-acetyltransferase